MRRPFGCRVNSNLFDCLLYILYKLMLSMWNVKVATVDDRGLLIPYSVFCIQYECKQNKGNSDKLHAHVHQAKQTFWQTIEPIVFTFCIHIHNIQYNIPRCGMWYFLATWYSLLSVVWLFFLFTTLYIKQSLSIIPFLFWVWTFNFWNVTEANVQNWN